MLRFIGVLLAAVTVGCVDKHNPSADQLQVDYIDPSVASREVIDGIIATPEGRTEVERVGEKDIELTRFQIANGISERIAEAAIKEWVLKHQGNFEWDLEEVKRICLRNNASGIPHEYLPESEK